MADDFASERRRNEGIEEEVKGPSVGDNECLALGDVLKRCMNMVMFHAAALC